MSENMPVVPGEQGEIQPLFPEFAQANLSIESTMDKFLSAASVESVYSQPVQHGEYLIIPAAEVFSVAGFGTGFGGGMGSPTERGGGGGGGGGGRVLARPAAVIVASPDGVRVKPVVDTTKITLAFLTALGFIVGAFFRMRRGDIS